MHHHLEQKITALGSALLRRELLESTLYYGKG